MAITVVTQRDNDGAPWTRETFAEANFIYVNTAGLLEVQIQNKQTLGTYAPGNWISVHRDEVVEVRTGS
jgi:hypothetical protein